MLPNCRFSDDFLIPLCYAIEVVQSTALEGTQTMHQPYIAFLLRLWQTGEGDQGNWLASLEDPHTHQVTGFENLVGLYEYLKNLETQTKVTSQTSSDTSLSISSEAKQ